MRYHLRHGEVCAPIVSPAPVVAEFILAFGVIVALRPVALICALHHPPPRLAAGRAAAALGRASQQARLDQRLGECGEMCAAVWLRCDCPDGAAVATMRTICHFAGSVIIAGKHIVCHVRFIWVLAVSSP